MKPKHFKYISKTKVTMLHDQVKSNREKLTEFSPKVALAGVEIELGFKREQQSTKSLFVRTLELSSALEERGLVHDLEQRNVLNSTGYYQNTGVWHNGVLSWTSAGPYSSDAPCEELAAYFVFRILGDSMFLLVGSASHVIGGEEPSATFHRTPCTEWAYHIYLRQHIAAYLKADRELVHPSTILNEHIPDDKDVYPLSLGLFCLEDVQSLSQMHLEVVFKIYQHWQVRKHIARLARFEDGRYVLSYADKMGLFRFAHLYVGSPLYTATP
jgi:hypothetical protein